MFIKEKIKSLTKEHITKQCTRAGFCDLLGYVMMLDDNTVLHSDGALSKHFLYRGPDLASSIDTELLHHSDTWQQALSFLGNGWMIETNVITQPFSHYDQPCEFPELVSALIDNERRMQFKQQNYFYSHYYLSITYKPETIMDAKFREFAIHGEQLDVGLDSMLSDFNNQVGEFVGKLKRSLAITPLSDNQLTTYLHQCITGNTTGLVKPDMGNFLSSYLSTDDFLGGFAPMIGSKHIIVLALDDLPSYAYPTLLDELCHLPTAYRWSSRFVCLDKLTAGSYLKRIEKNWSSRAIGIMGVIKESMGLPVKLDEDAMITADIIKQAQTDNSGSNLNFGFYNSVIILMDEDPNKLQHIADKLKEQIQHKQFRVRIEDVNATESYLGSLPSHGGYNLRKCFIDTQFVSFSLPLSSLYQGEKTAPCKRYGDAQPALLYTATTGNRPFMLNLHVTDVGHTAILGPTGMGKTTLVSMLMAAHRKYAGSRIIVMDKDRSNAFIIKALDGAYYDLNHTDCRFAPLTRVDKDNPKACDVVIEWLVDIIHCQGIHISPEQRRLLRDAVLRLAEEPQAYRNLDHLTIQDPILREAIQAFNTGAAQRLLSGTENMQASDIMGFEMGSLIQAGNQNSFASLIIKAIFNELDFLFQDKRPTLLVLEEAWLYLKHPLFQEKLNDWFKTLRKSNVAVIFISQELSDIVNADADAGSTIRTSCMTRIFLPNKAAKEVQEQYASFGLNAQQIELIKNATPKQDYYYQSEKGARLFQLDMGPLTQSFICIDNRKDGEHFQQIYRKNDSHWVVEWLKHKKLYDWAKTVEQTYFGEIDEKKI